MEFEFPNTISANFIGSMAQRVLSMSASASILGISSGGIFLKTNIDWILYISGAKYRGPLTIIVKRYEELSCRLASGMAVDIQSDLLAFPEPGLTVATKGSRVWEPEPGVLAPLPLSEQVGRWKTIASGILDTHPGAEIETALRDLLANPACYQTGADESGLQSENITRIIKLQGRMNLVDTSKLLINSLGKGPGLTPGGDDLTTGVLLSLNRWKPQSLTNDQLKNLNEEIVNQAYRKTTTLSANLLECATNGLADERLLNALDWIKSGIPFEELALIDGLLSWGNTSGVEAFIGFLFAMNIQGN